MYYSKLLFSVSLKCPQFFAVIKSCQGDSTQNLFTVNMKKHVKNKFPTVTNTDSSLAGFT